MGEVTAPKLLGPSPLTCLLNAASDVVLIPG